MTALRPYRQKNNHVLAIFLVVLVLIFSLFSFTLRGFFVSAVYPLQFAVASVWKGIVAVPGEILSLIYLSSENHALKKEVNALKARQILLEELERENMRYRSDLAFKTSSRFNVLAAQVIGRSPAPWFPILEINQGSRAGVRVNMPVIVRAGLVGKVIEVSPLVSKVLVIIAPESQVAAVNARSRDNGVVVGNGSNRLHMKYVNLGGDVREMDEVVTSHISTIFPAGIPIGQITHTSRRGEDLFRFIEIKPAVDFSKLEEVFIIY